MSLKGFWTDKQDEIDDIRADHINSVAHAVIELEENVAAKEDKSNKIDDFSKIDIFSNEQYPTAKLVKNTISEETLYVYSRCTEETDGKLEEKEDISNKATNLDDYFEDDTKYASAKAIKTYGDTNFLALWQKITEIDTNIGDIDTALDSILEIQNGLLGGTTE